MYPSQIWDGDSPTRDSDGAPYRSPDAEDWNRGIQEIAAVQSRCGVGALAGTPHTGLTVEEQTINGVQKVVLTLDDYSIEIIKGAEGSYKEFGNTPVFVFPANVVKIIASTVDLYLEGNDTNLSATADGDYALGTAAAIDIALSGARVDIHAATAIAQLVDREGPVVGLDDAKNAVNDPGTCYLNLSFDDGMATDDTSVTVNGTITLAWIDLGVLDN